MLRSLRTGENAWKVPRGSGTGTLFSDTHTHTHTHTHHCDDQGQQKGTNLWMSRSQWKTPIIKVDGEGSEGGGREWPPAATRMEGDPCSAGAVKVMNLNSSVV